MIILFHSLYVVVQHLLKIYRTAKAIRQFQLQKLIHEDVSNRANCVRTDSNDLRFDPPLYQQRYIAVQEILLNENWKSHIAKVVDFGCSELNFFKYLKHLYDITEIICVDVDEDILTNNLFKVQPLTVDYLKRRPSPLLVQVLNGCVSQPDARLRGANTVIAIELIEHLYPDTLEALPYNIFHYIKPVLAIFTTPNYEFNILFPDKKQYRHPDHKFEWTREQFQSWALNIVTRFPNYTVQFDGIGPGPEGMDSLGCCTQIAVFLKHSDDNETLSEVPRSCREILNTQELNRENLTESQGICTYYSYVKQILAFDGVADKPNDRFYKEVQFIQYPFHVDNRSREERILEEVRYKLYSTTMTSRFYNSETERLEYPVLELMENDEGCFTTFPELSKLLEKEKFQLEECLISGCNTKSLCVIHYLSMENHSSSPSSDGNNSDDKGANWNITADESDWEAEYNQSVKINDEVVESNEQKPEESKVGTACSTTLKEQKVTLQFHSTLPNTSGSTVETKDEVKRERSSAKRQTSSQLKLPSTSTSRSTDKTPKKGTNIKNKDVHTSLQSTSKESESRKRKNDSNISNNIDNNDKRSYKKSIELKVHDSAHSQVSNVKNNRNAKSSASSNKSTSKGKVMTTSSLKRFPVKIEDTSLPSTSDLRKKKKGKKSDEDKEDIKTLTECIIYNTLNNIPEVDENLAEASSSDGCKIKVRESISQIATPILSNIETSNNTIGHDMIEQVLRNAEMLLNAIGSSSTSSNGSDERKNKDLISEPTNQELNHASREALFDPNSETDMLEEFEIPPPPPPPPMLQIPAIEHRNVILIGITPTNEEEAVVLPDNADPFPNWLLQLLGANVEEGESHDEPHFYCQGDGIGVHPSIVEVEIDEEESSSDSSSSHHEAEAGYTSSDSGVVQLPTDDMEERNLQEDNAMGIPLNRTPGSTSAADSTDEFFDSLEETLTITSRSNSQNRRN